MNEPLKISNSELTTFRDCRRKWYLEYYRRFKTPEKDTGALALGTNVHTALATYYSPGGNKGLALGILTSIYEEAREKRNGLTDQELEKEAKLARIMVEGYFDWIEEEGVDANLEILEAESEIEHSTTVLNTPIRLVGKRDAIGVNTDTGTSTLIDHKGQPYSSLVLTPTGWIKMGDLVVGSKVLNHRHHPTTVVGVFELGIRDIYEVEFSDRTTVQCTEDHLWEHFDGKVVELSYWMKLKNKPQPIIGSEPDFLESRTNLPLDPYSLGCFLGDGSFRRTTPTFSNINSTLFKRLDLEMIVPLDGRCTYANAYSWTEPLHSLGLFQCRSEEKFIPQQYLYASATDRLELLRGLLDTDGYIHNSKGNTHFDTSSPMLAEDVMFLVRSLGGWSTGHQHETYYTKNAERHSCLPSWRIAIRIPTNPFWLEKKALLWDQFQKSKNRPRRPNKIVKSIKAVGSAQARCIKVSDNRGLYITDGYTVTHNTCQSLNDPALDLNEQARMYLLLQRLNGSTPLQNCTWNLLRKVQRTATAKPPFYAREDIYVSEDELRRFWTRIHGIIRDILGVRAALDSGESHYSVCYPRPSRDCSWKCPYRVVCPMIDSEGPAIEKFLSDQYTEGDPYARYEPKGEA